MSREDKNKVLIKTRRKNLKHTKRRHEEPDRLTEDIMKQTDKDDTDTLTTG